MACAIARAPRAWRNPLLMLFILPFWTSFLIRVYAWIGILKTNGLINNALIAGGLIDQPLTLLNNSFSVELALVYSYLPFMVLPLYATLERMEPALLEAACDLGCRPFRAFLAVTLPLSLPGIAAGCLVVFIPAVGEFVIPDLLGGPIALAQRALQRGEGASWPPGVRRCSRRCSRSAMSSSTRRSSR